MGIDEAKIMQSQKFTFMFLNMQVLQDMILQIFISLLYLKLNLYPLA